MLYEQENVSIARKLTTNFKVKNQLPSYPQTVSHNSYLMMTYFRKACLQNTS